MNSYLRYSKNKPWRIYINSDTMHDKRHQAAKVYYLSHSGPSPHRVIRAYWTPGECIKFTTSVQPRFPSQQVTIFNNKHAPQQTPPQPLPPPTSPPTWSLTRSTVMYNLHPHLHNNHINKIIIKSLLVQRCCELTY